MKKERGKSVFGSVLVIVILLVVLVGIVMFLAPKFVKNTVCVSRTVVGDSEKTVTLDVDVSFFKRPNSFIVEEKIPSTWIFSESNPKELFNSESGKLSWMFWKGGLPVRDTKIVYTVNNADAGEVTGKLISGAEIGNPSAGYNEIAIGAGKSCL